MGVRIPAKFLRKYKVCALKKHIVCKVVEHKMVSTYPSHAFFYQNTVGMYFQNCFKLSSVSFISLVLHS